MEEQTTDFIFGGIVGLFAWFFGGLDGFLSVLISCIIIDWVLGTLNSYIHNGFEKFTLKEFLTVWGRKIGELCFVGLAHLFDKYMLGNTAACRFPIILFYIVVETKSILGHVNAFNLPVPKFVQSRLLEIEKKLDNDEKLTRGESISKAIDSEIFRKPEKTKHDIKQDIDDIYANIYGEDE